METTSEGTWKPETNHKIPSTIAFTPWTAQEILMSRLMNFFSTIVYPRFNQCLDSDDKWITNGKTEFKILPSSHLLFLFPASYLFSFVIAPFCGSSIKANPKSVFSSVTMFYNLVSWDFLFMKCRDHNCYA